MNIEFDLNKAELNESRHGVTFLDAAYVFRDECRLLDDVQHRSSEVRERVIGMVDGIILVVVYTMRNDTFRIISARKAESHERKRYEENRFRP